MSFDVNPIDDTPADQSDYEKWEQSINDESKEQIDILACKQFLEPILEEFGSRVLMLCLAETLKSTESAGNYAYIGKILENLAEWEP